MEQLIINSSFLKASYVQSYFDRIYLVNLPNNRQDKYKSIFNFKKHNIEVELFEATNGYSEENKEIYSQYAAKPLGNLHFNEFSDLEIRRNSKFINSPGAMGYILTYIRILKDAQQRGYKRILIFEDDVLLIKNFEFEVKKFLLSINPNWKIIQLGASQYGWKSLSVSDAKKRGYYFPRILDTCGSFAIGLDCSIYEELITNLSYFDAPFDHIPIGKLYEKYLGKCYVAFPSIAMADVSDSSIRNSRNQYEHSTKMKWPLSRYSYPLKKLSLSIIFESKKSLVHLWNYFSSSPNDVNLNLLFNSSSGIIPVHDKKYLENIKFNGAKSNYADILNSIDSDIIITVEDDVLIEPNEFSQFINNIYNGSYKVLPGIQLFTKTFTGYKNINTKYNIPINPNCDDIVSVIISTYKRPRVVRNAIKSVINQTYKNIEIIVIDDNGFGSFEQIKTQKTIDKIASNKNIEIVYVPLEYNSGGATARNVGIFKSSGNYIAFLDDDDIYTPNKISDCLSRLKSMNNDYGGVYGGYLGWNSDSNNLARYPEGDLSINLLTLDYTSHYLNTNTSLFKKSALLWVNGFNGGFKRHQDLEINLRFFEHYKICSVKEIVSKTRPNPVQNDNTLNGDQLFELKIDFFILLKDIVNRQSEELKSEIFERHRKELIRYFKSETNLKDFISSWAENNKSKSSEFYKYLEKNT